MGTAMPKWVDVLINRILEEGALTAEMSKQRQGGVCVSTSGGKKRNLWRIGARREGVLVDISPLNRLEEGGMGYRS
jgi:hypothetical protein